ncbi:MAG: NCS2 family permease [Flavonifractor plautii]
MKSVLADRLFHLKENGTTVRRECFAGLTTFVTMAYILAVNPAILGAAGMDRGAVFTASALAACAATLLMALLSNYPFALAPGMGLNAYFAYTVVIKRATPGRWPCCGLPGGLLFIVLSVTSVRRPSWLHPRPPSGRHLRHRPVHPLLGPRTQPRPSTMLSVYPFREAIASGEIRSVGLGAVLAFAGILLTAILTIRRVKGALLLGILAVWGAAILCQLTGLYVPNAELGMASVLPDFSAGLAVPSLAPTFMQMDFTGLFTLNFLTVVLSFLFVDVFDTLGGIIGMASQGHMLDENGRLPRIRGALLSDAVGTSVGAVLGTSTTTTFAESAAGIAAGGRTGLTSVVTALMFLLSLFLSPLFLAVPGFATAPALVIVGLSMLGSLRALDPADWRESLPAYLTMVAMPFCYSISEGIAVGTISYVAVHLFTGAESRKKVSPVLAVLAVLFLLKYIFL